MRGLTNDQRTAIDVLRDTMSVRKIAKHIGAPKSTVHDYLKRTQSSTDLKSILGKRILLLDIETSPILAMVWGRFKQFVSQEQVLRESNMLTYTAKWLGDTKAIINAVEAEDTSNDYDMAKEIRDLLDECDVVIAHNGDKFDFPYVNTRIEYHGLKQPSPYKVIDTLKIAKKRFRFSSNSLDAIAAYFGLEQKKKHSGFDLWKRTVAGDQAAIDEMLEYNIQDIVVLEQVYMKLRHWDKTHPSASVILGDNCCPVCAGTNLKPTNKFHITGVSKYPLTQCDDCGKFIRNRVNVLDRNGIGVGV